MTTLRALLCLSAVLLLGASALPAAQASEKRARVTWEGRRYEAEQLPAELGPAPRAAAKAWAGWCGRNRYELDLSPDGRVLLVCPKGSSKLSRFRSLTKRTTALFDKLLPSPAPPEPEPEPDAEAEAPGSEEVPEDPDGGPVGLKPRDLPRLPFTYEYTWGTGSRRLGVDTAVMFVLRGEVDYRALLAELKGDHAYLAGWTTTAEKLTGFVIEDPLAGAFLESASGQEEWSPDNEFVHRLAELLFIRDYGQQPFWMLQGCAWYVELKLLRAVYCFPYRSEFVWATEHTGWPSELKRRFAGDEPRKLDLGELVKWRRGSYDGKAAVLAWGTMHYLLKEHGDALPALLLELHEFRDENNRVDTGGGSWKRDPTYALPLADLQRMLCERCGEDVLTQAAAYFKKGKAR